jgi:hypothetical protein
MQPVVAALVVLMRPMSWWVATARPVRIRIEPRRRFPAIADNAAAREQARRIAARTPNTRASERESGRRRG